MIAPNLLEFTAPHSPNTHLPAGAALALLPEARSEAISNDDVALQQLVPATVMYMMDAVDVVPDVVAGHYPAEVVSAAKRKVHAALPLSILNSMGSYVAGVLEYPNPVIADSARPVQLEATGEMEPVISHGSLGATAMFNVPTLPDFRIVEAAPGVQRIIDKAFVFEAARLLGVQRTARANAIAARIRAARTLQDDKEYKEAQLARQRNSVKETSDERALATGEPIHFEPAEAAFVAAALRLYDPVAVHERLAEELLSVPIPAAVAQEISLRLLPVSVRTIAGSLSVPERLVRHYAHTAAHIHAVMHNVTASRPKRHTRLRHAA